MFDIDFGGVEEAVFLAGHPVGKNTTGGVINVRTIGNVKSRRTALSSHSDSHTALEGVRHAKGKRGIECGDGIAAGSCLIVITSAAEVRIGF